MSSPHRFDPSKRQYPLHNVKQQPARRPSRVPGTSMPELVPYRSDRPRRPTAAQRWWRRTGLNRRPPACKAGALPLSYAPSCLVPQHGPARAVLVGPGRFELPTSRLSSARSNQLSYEPGSLHELATCLGLQPKARSCVSSIGSGRDAWAALDRIGRALFHLGRTRDGQSCDRCKYRRQSDVSIGLLPILRKEVIQPQVPLRLPCYDFTPVADLTVDGCLLAVSAPA